MIVGGGLTIDGSLTSGGIGTASAYVTGADNIILGGNATGVSGIFFKSEKDGININHNSDFGFIQFHAYGIGGSAGENNRLVIGVSNDSTDKVVLNSPTLNGVVATVGTVATEYVVYHSGNLPTYPTGANNATITLSAGTGLVTGGSFTTNQSSNATITFNVASHAGSAGTIGK